MPCSYVTNTHAISAQLMHDVAQKNIIVASRRSIQFRILSSHLLSKYGNIKSYKIIILYGRQTWCLMLSEEDLSLFQCRVLMGIFGSNRGFRRMHNEELDNFYTSKNNNHNKEDGLALICSTHWSENKCIQNFSWGSTGKIYY